MRILIVNDDGMHAAALPHLIRWARKLGDVTCVVPKTEQSGKSQAIDFLHPVEIKEVPLSVDIRVWAMDSTPADCVRFGATGLKKDYDLILSGINRGYNFGNDIAYSGTVGAINEGGRLGIPAIALSYDVGAMDEALGMLDYWWDFMNRNGLLEKGSMYNVNFPHCTTPKGIRVTRQGGEFFSDAFEYRGDNMYMQVGAPVEYDRCDLTIDIDATRAGYISVTPMAWQRMDWKVYEAVKDIAE
jgi:5'-nucleotidase